MKNKYVVLILIAFAVVVFLPPLLHEQTYLAINNDTAAHLLVFEAMKNGGANFLYLGQALTGYALIAMEKVTRIEMNVLFMWFNFAVLLIAGIVGAIMVVLITKSKLAGAITPFVIVFGIGSTMHLFYSGTIFNIIEVSIIFPILITLLYTMINERKAKWLVAIVPISLLLFFFHPSLGEGVTRLFRNYPNPEAVINPIAALALFFGSANIALAILCGIAFHIRNNKEKTGVGIKIVMAILLVLAVLLAVLAFTGATPFSSRMAINLCLILGLALCIYIGVVLKRNGSKLATALIISLAVVGIMPNLITWLSFPNYKEVLSVLIR